MPTINAAGTVPWRLNGDALEVALVHRPRYDDWSWSKGKLEGNEPWPVAAVRETHEETGLEVRLGLPLPATSYRVLDRSGEPATKHVRYWAAQVVGGHGRLENEIDDMLWLDGPAAHTRLDYSHDREQLRALQQAHQRGILASTWPMLIVRHALAVPRSAWKGGTDSARPLSPEGVSQVPTISAILAAYGVRSLVSSPSARCVATIAEYAASRQLDVDLEPGLSEERFAARGPKRAAKVIKRVLASGVPTAICSHGPLLPSLINLLLLRAAAPVDEPSGPADLLVEAADLGMEKGEILVAHLTGVGDDAVVLAVERVPAPVDLG